MFSLLVAGVLVRLALWAWFRDQPIHIWDEQDYNRIAVNLVQRGEFGLHAGTPTSLRPPLYPTTLAVVYRLFGLENFQAVRLLQAGLSLLTALLLFRLGSEVSGRRVGYWLSALYAFYPSLLGFNTLLLTEVLFTFLLCAACLLLIRTLRHQSMLYLLGAGVVLGLGALTRSVLWPFSVVLSILLLWWWPGDLKRRGAAAGLLAAAFAVTIAPWVFRNTRLEETIVVIDTIGGRNFMMGNYRFTPLYRAWDAVALQGEESWYHELATTYPPSELVTQGQIDRLAFRHGIAFVLDNPGLTLQRDVVKVFHFWGLERELIAGAARGYFGEIPKPAILLLTLLIFGSYTSALISGLFGMVMVPPSDRRVHRLLLLVIGFICAVHVVTFGHSRYHLPIMPIVLLYSASALVQAGEIWRRRHERSFHLAAGLSGIFILGWLGEILFVDGERYLNMLRPV